MENQNKKNRTFKLTFEIEDDENHIGPINVVKKELGLLYYNSYLSKYELDKMILSELISEAINKYEEEYNKSIVIIQTGDTHNEI